MNDLTISRGGRDYVIPRGIEAKGGKAIERWVAEWEAVEFASDRALEVAIDLELEPADFEGQTGTGDEQDFRTDDVREIAEAKAAAEESPDDEERNR